MSPQVGSMFGNDDDVPGPARYHLVASGTDVVLPRLVRLDRRDNYRLERRVHERLSEKRPDHQCRGDRGKADHESDVGGGAVLRAKGVESHGSHGRSLSEPNR